MKKLIVTLVVLFVMLLGLYEIVHWGFERVYVAEDEALMVIKKFGDPLPPDRIVVPAEDTRYKGVLQELKGPGRYFMNPITYDWKVVPLTVIPAGDPSRWHFDSNGHVVDKKALPQIGLVALKEGKSPPP